MEKETEFAKTGKLMRVFAVRVDSPQTLNFIINKTVTDINKIGFMHYLSHEKISTASAPKTELYATDMQVKEFRKCGGKENCAILFNEDVGIAYPESLEVIIGRYNGIKIFRFIENEMVRV